MKRPSPENIRIKFPSYKTPGVKFLQESDAQGRTCFIMSGGNVEVFPPGLDGNKRYYVHLEIRFGIHGKPEKCLNANADGCGGIVLSVIFMAEQDFINCTYSVYCDICNIAGDSYRKFVQIYKGGQPAQCNLVSFAPGIKNDVSLRVCLPNENELLPLLDKNVQRAQQIMDIAVSTRAKAGKIPVVIAARLFDRPINNIPMSTLNDMLFGSKTGMIGCHYIYATATKT
uniref:Macro domain-containing protein n=1 Tax=Syphacia muris TaxID=451379 RepID=A0A0N5AQU0_9BILA